MDRTSLLKAVGVIAEHRDLDDRKLLAALERAGFPRATAADLVELVPLAFGRALLQGARFSSQFVRVDRAGKERRRGALAAQPVFRAAVTFAPEVERDQGELFLAVAGRSPELHAAHLARKAGKDLSHLELPPPRLVWDWASPPPAAPPLPLPDRRRWWEFWKR